VGVSGEAVALEFELVLEPAFGLHVAMWQCGNGEKILGFHEQIVWGVPWRKYAGGVSVDMVFIVEVAHWDVPQTGAGIGRRSFDRALQCCGYFQEHCP
jgi:hypothetical protein